MEFLKNHSKCCDFFVTFFLLRGLIIENIKKEKGRGVVKTSCGGDYEL
ncbi:MAG: hypothetical protein MRZ82_02650 [Firmicutes bacterium]|nr:hypothetical protein [Bacillota bacterium]